MTAKIVYESDTDRNENKFPQIVDKKSIGLTLILKNS